MNVSFEISEIPLCTLEFTLLSITLFHLDEHEFVTYLFERSISQCEGEMIYMAADRFCMLRSVCVKNDDYPYAHMIINAICKLR